MGIFCIIPRVFWSFLALHALALLFSASSLLRKGFSAEGVSSFIPKNETDQLALLQFKTHVTNDPYGVLSSWNSSTHFCQWHGIKCGRHHQRVTALLLGSSKLVGHIPPHIGNLSFLRLLDLSNNSLSQEIPPELGNLSRLKYLLLPNNSLRGQIPSNISFCSNLVGFSVSGNLLLVGKIPVEFGTLSKLEKFGIRDNDLTGSIPTTFGNLSSLQIFSAARNRISGIIPEGLGQLTNLTYIALSGNRLSANLIGNGSFGSVYKGTIVEAGTIAAIKVLNLPRHGASKSFAVECEALRNIRHRNLVKILTACSSIDYQGNDFKALIYEFMVNGSLEEWLHPTPRTDEENELAPIRSSLNLLQRINIAVDVASALEYLHSDSQPPVVHCDLKPSNILLDEEMVAHIGDFGIARILPEAAINLSSNQSSSIGVRGTIGYTAPEYGTGSEISTNGDVYSYGVLLLEMFSGKRPADGMFKDNLNLHAFVKAALPMNVVEISDPMLLEEVKGETRTYASRSQNSESGRRIRECLVSIFSIGVACSAENPAERMSIRNVATELNSIRKKLVEIGKNHA